MKVGLVVVAIDGVYRAKIKLGEVPKTLPCEKVIFRVIEEEKFWLNPSLKKQRVLIERVKEIAKKQARMYGISHIENLNLI